MGRPRSGATLGDPERDCEGENMKFEYALLTSRLIEQAARLQQSLAELLKRLTEEE